MPRAWDDPEWSGLRKLWNAAPPGVSRAEVARVWARVRQERNRAALARMRKGDSSAGFRAREFPAYTTSVFVYECAVPATPDLAPKEGWGSPKKV